MVAFNEDLVCYEKSYKFQKIVFEDDQHSEFVPFFMDPRFAKVSSTFSSSKWVLQVPKVLDTVNLVLCALIFIVLAVAMILYIRAGLAKFYAVRNIKAAHEDLQQLVEDINFISKKRRHARMLLLPKEHQDSYEEAKKKREEFRQIVAEERCRHSTVTEIPAGTVLNGYTVEKKLGEGSFGVVYMVRGPDGKSYAMKTEGLFENFTYGLKVDIAVLTSVQPNGHFCSLVDAGVFHDRKYIIMSVLGKSLADYLCIRAPLSMGSAFGLARQALQALEKLHEAGYGENFMTGSSENLEESRKLYLIDFGTAGRFNCPMCVRKSKLLAAGKSWEEGLNVIGVKEFEKTMAKMTKEEKDAFLAAEVVKLDEDWNEIVDNEGTIKPEKDVNDVVKKKRKEAAGLFKEFFLADQVTLNIEAVTKELKSREKIDEKSNFRAFFDNKGVINEKLAKEWIEEERHKAESDAEFVVRWRVKNAKRILAKKRCRHAPLPWMAKVGKHPIANIDPYELYRCPNTACFSAAIVSASEKPYGRKDDLESWYYVMLDWVTKLKFRICNDDVEKGHLARLKISSRYGADARYLLTHHDESDILNGIEAQLLKDGQLHDVPVDQLQSIIHYIDSLEYFEEPNYKFIYDVLDQIMQENQLQEFPLDWEKPDWDLPEPASTPAMPAPLSVDSSKIPSDGDTKILVVAEKESNESQGSSKTPSKDKTPETPSTIATKVTQEESDEKLKVDPTMTSGSKRKTCGTSGDKK
ncbi:hypothetical protein L596_026379 [Steinernema carpocapsae]|uniref:Protein kinase domain-containing protein n=1 Tax=Steinernema carpocapsae TaxID=34508 RepID=A0A4U5M161_STECR|nr:hypothetical protein L596_026379 [Steinernema carpocapsae]